MSCPPKSILPKGTLAPNSGNQSAAMSRAQQILQNKSCGIYGVVTGPPGPQGEPGINGNNGATGATGATGAADLLNINNTWTGINSFTNATTVPNLVFPLNTTNAVNSSYLTSNYVNIATAQSISGQKTFSSNILASGIGGTTPGAGFAFCGSTTSGNIAMCGLSSGGTVTLANGGSKTGAISIGSGNSNSNALNLSNGATYSGSVNIVTGATTGGTINLATGTGVTQTTDVNISTGSTTGAVTIGNSANTTTINSNLTLAKPITLGSAPTSSSQLGYVAGGNFNSSTLTASPYAFPLSFQLPIGTFLFVFNAQIKYTSGTWNSNFAAPYSGLTSGALTTNLTDSTSGNIGATSLIDSISIKYIGLGGSTVITITTANLYYTYGFTWTASVLPVVTQILGSFQAIRIA